MVNIRQSPLYGKFMRSINWQVETIEGVQIFIKKFPFLPAVIKIQRPDKLPNFNKLKSLMQKYGARTITVEPASHLKIENLKLKISSDPYIHTKTFQIDLASSETTIFNRFTEAKRRAVRRAQKSGVTVEISDNIEAFIKLKNRTAGFFLGWLTTHGVTRPLWNTFSPNHAKVLLAYFKPNHQQYNNLTMKPFDSVQGKQARNYVAGILLLYYHKTAYYWMAAANPISKKNFAPTLLIWEAFKFAKKTGCTVFDFEGVYDERFPDRSRDWQGFSKFKAGFGGKPIFYPQPFIIK